MEKLVILFAIVCACVGLYLYMIAPARRKRGENTGFFYSTFFAHRGLHGESTGLPENSLAAFAAAADNGCGIEMDIRLTKDGIPVVFHDNDTERMCGVKNRISKMTLAEVKSLHLSGTDQSIPTLQDALDIIAGRVPILAELKLESLRTSLCRRVDEILSTYGGDYVVESFNPLALRWYKRHRKEILRGQLSTAFTKEFSRWNPLCHLLENLMFNFLSRPDFIAYNCEYSNKLAFRLCTKRFGALPVAWTVQDEEELSRLGKTFKTFIFENFLPKKPQKDGENADLCLSTGRKNQKS